MPGVLSRAECGESAHNLHEVLHFTCPCLHRRLTFLPVSRTLVLNTRCIYMLCSGGSVSERRHFHRAAAGAGDKGRKGLSSGACGYGVGLPNI